MGSFWTSEQCRVGKAGVGWNGGGLRLESCHLPLVGSVPGLHVGLPRPQGQTGKESLYGSGSQSGRCVVLLHHHVYSAMIVLVWKWRLLCFQNFLSITPCAHMERYKCRVLNFARENSELLRTWADGRFLCTRGRTVGI